VANDTGKTYLYRAEDIMGPWRKSTIEGFFHDCSLLFDDDGRTYIVYGNREIHLTELNSEMTAPKQGGLNRIIVKEENNHFLCYEGSHIYKINGKYYVFFIHSRPEGWRRTEACFIADSLESVFVGDDCFNDDLGYHGSGIAQGGIVDTPDGEWYSILFQDHGAVGRIPVLVPVHWEKGKDFPVFGVDGKAPHEITVKSTRPEHVYESLYTSDDFNYTPDKDGKVRLNKLWQWNHTPSDKLWSVTEKPGAYRIRTDKLSPNLVLAANTLTQRMMGPACEGYVTVDASAIKDEDYAGICALQGNYGLIAITKEEGRNYLVMLEKEINPEEGFGGPKGGDKKPGKETSRVPFNGSKVILKVKANFVDGIDEAEFYYKDGSQWIKLGITHKLQFRLDHFCGCRFGLFLFSTKETGGTADFEHFVYNVIE
jgi:beta-xylosidase